MKKLFPSFISIMILISVSTHAPQLFSKPGFVIAVLDFKDATGDPSFSYLRIAVPEIFATNLAQVREITVLERERIKKILKENGLIMAGVTEGDEKKIGKLLSAKQLMSGTIVKTGKSLRVDVRLTDISTGKIVIADKKRCGTIDEVLDAVDLLSEKVVKKITGMDISFVKDIDEGKSASIKGNYIDLEILKQNKYYLADSTDPFYLRAGFYSKKVEAQKRLPLNISIVLDRSGSMSSEGKLDYAKQAMKFIIKNLSGTDIVSVVTYDDTVEVLIPPGYARDKDRLNGMIDNIAPGGSTNLSGGLLEGINQVKAKIKSGQVNRVLLISDGLANVGITSPERIHDISRRYSREGITISTFGVGQYFNEKLLTGISEYGNANYYYIDKSDKIPEIFSRELSGLLAVVAQNCTIRISPAGGSEIREVFGYKYDNKGNFINIKMGDIVSEEKKLAVIKLSPSLGKKGAMKVARISFSYDDAVGNRGRIKVEKDIEIIFTENRDLVRDNLNAVLMKDVEMFISSEMMEETMDLVDRGDYKKANDKIDDNLNRVRMGLKMYRSREMKKQALNIIEYREKLKQASSMSAGERERSFKSMQKKGRMEQYDLRKRK